MQQPRSGRLSGTVFWPDGTTLFNGYVAVASVLPVQNGINAPEWARISILAGYPTLKLPLWTKIRIQDGVFDQGISLWYNEDMRPYGSTYVAYYYDDTGTSVGPVTGQFTIAAAATAIPQSITVTPEAGTTIPSPVEVT